VITANIEDIREWRERNEHLLRLKSRANEFGIAWNNGEQGQHLIPKLETAIRLHLTKNQSPTKETIEKCRQRALETVQRMRQLGDSSRVDACVDALILPSDWGAQPNGNGFTNSTNEIEERVGRHFIRVTNIPISPVNDSTMVSCLEMLASSKFGVIHKSHAEVKAWQERCEHRLNRAREEATTKSKILYVVVFINFS
tara:strand:- start:190 stop:783 length:594 start_codon:yes stop_codon:yes gene_type:complete